MPLGVGIATAVALLALADRWLQPVPVPAALATLAGAVALGLTADRGAPREAARALIWSLLGLLVGIGVHLGTHRTGGSPEPAEGVPVHLGLDAARSAAVAAGALVVVAVAVRAARRPLR